jgi:3-oxoacyl-[acyl-carrier protein] reductase
VDLELGDRVALISGASRGIGRAIASSLAREGCRVAICARDADTLAAAAKEMRTDGAQVLEFPADLTEQDAAGRFVERSLEEFRRIDVVVNNVGGNRRKPFVETTDQDWRELIDLNFGSHVRLSRAAVATMERQGNGVILFVSSIFGREAGGPDLSIYNATKAALISLAKILSLELAPHGIRVNSLAPGSILFEGGSWDRRQKADPQDIAAFVERNLPLGRFGRLEEVADVATFLASDRASLITGACITVDGGQSRSLI